MMNYDIMNLQLFPIYNPKEIILGFLSHVNGLKIR